jgi:hypothetical protein
MSGWQILGLLVTGGVIGEGLFDLLRAGMQESAKDRRTNKMQQDRVADRKRDMKRKAYQEMLDLMHYTSMRRLMGQINYAITDDELKNRMKIFNAVDIHGSSEVKGLAARLFDFFSKKDLNKDQHEPMIKAMEDLTQKVREEV